MGESGERLAKIALHNTDVILTRPVPTCYGSPDIDRSERFTPVLYTLHSTFYLIDRARIVMAEGDQPL